MHDIRLIRQDPQAFDKALAKRFLAPQSEAILALDEAYRQVLTSVQEMQSQRNALSKSIGEKKRKNQSTSEVESEVSALKTRLAEQDEKAQSLQEELRQILEGLPNLPAAEVPEGKDESANQEIRRWGQPRSFDFEPKQHFDVGEALGMIDFETAAYLSGARFAVIRGALARLERALAQFMLNTHSDEFGYLETQPPYMVRDAALYGTGQLPKFAEDLFKTDTGHYLIPTSEVPMTNYVAEKIVDKADLPLRFTAHTPCFRSEAGSAGRDTRGLIRMHQFHKVELVSITTAEESMNELERMTNCAEEILKRLDLPYRVMLLSSGDMGFGAVKTYDLEVWLPGQNTYREISSCSNCGAFQARRMNARYRDKGEKSTEFVHSLNGSGLATGRALVAVIENYQQADGSIVVPEVLRPYMGGLEVIS